MHFDATSRFGNANGDCTPANEGVPSAPGRTHPESWLRQRPAPADGAYARPMTDDATDPDNLPNGSGEGDTSSTGSDDASGGAPEQPDTSQQPNSTRPHESDGTPPNAGVEPPD
jgi:hypothetical protein